MTNSPHANYLIEGLNPTITHRTVATRYCIAQAVPAINGITLRIHGESGVAEGSYDFGKCFRGCRPLQPPRRNRSSCERHRPADDRKRVVHGHARYRRAKILANTWALATCKARFVRWKCRHASRTKALARARLAPIPALRLWRFLTKTPHGGPPHLARHSTVIALGDPNWRRHYRASSFCGSSGVERFEPLSFKGRKGSGLPGVR
jgi:hypothetical protein